MPPKKIRSLHFQSCIAKVCSSSTSKAKCKMHGCSALVGNAQCTEWMVGNGRNAQFAASDLHQMVTQQNAHRFIFRSLEGCQAILMSNTRLQKVVEGNLEETTVAVSKILTPPVNWSKFQTSGPHPTGDGVYEGSRCKQFTRRPVQNLTHVLSKLGNNCAQKCPH